MNEEWVRPRGGNGKAVLIGIGAMLLGAGLWALVTVVTVHEVGFLAIVIGALIGPAMNLARPTSRGAALVAALLTVIGCAAGEFIAPAIHGAHARNLGFTEVLRYELEHPRVHTGAMSPWTYVFTAVGALVAFRMLLRRVKVTRELYVPSGAAPSPATSGPARPPYGRGPRQRYGASRPGYGEYPPR